MSVTSADRKAKENHPDRHPDDPEAHAKFQVSSRSSSSSSSSSSNSSSNIHNIHNHTLTHPPTLIYIIIHLPTHSHAGDRRGISGAVGRQLTIPLRHSGQSQCGG